MEIVHINDLIEVFGNEEELAKCLEEGSILFIIDEMNLKPEFDPSVFTLISKNYMLFNKKENKLYFLLRKRKRDVYELISKFMHVEIGYNAYIPFTRINSFVKITDIMLVKQMFDKGYIHAFISMRLDNENGLYILCKQYEEMSIINFERMLFSYFGRAFSFEDFISKILGREEYEYVCLQIDNQPINLQQYRYVINIKRREVREVAEGLFNVMKLEKNVFPFYISENALSIFTNNQKVVNRVEKIVNEIKDIKIFSGSRRNI